MIQLILRLLRRHCGGKDANQQHRSQQHRKLNADHIRQSAIPILKSDHPTQDAGVTELRRATQVIAETQKDAVQTLAPRAAAGADAGPARASNAPSSEAAELADDVLFHTG